MFVCYEASQYKMFVCVMRPPNIKCRVCYEASQYKMFVCVMRPPNIKCSCVL